jgi:GTPase SAR1 family protein
MAFLLSRLIGTATPSSTPTPSSTSKSSPVSPTSSSDKSAAPYHVRVLIRGDRETGKSALLKRLQGGAFIEQHVITPHIVSTPINWSYKTSEDLVNFEVWDVVDKARSPTKVATPNATNPSSTASPSPVSTPPDTPSAVSSKSIPVDAASCPDVYASAHAVIFLIDPTRDWTLAWVKAQLPLVPRHLDVLLLLNFRDLPDSQRLISDSSMQHFMRTQPANVKYLECSMKVRHTA